MKIPALLGFIALSFIATAQDNTYKKPVKEIMDLADIKPVPTPYFNRAATKVVFVQNADRMALEMLAEPELKLAGLRINPQNHNKARVNPAIGISLKDLTTGKDIAITGLPGKLAIVYAGYSPLENYFSFVNALPDKLELWVIDMRKAEAVKVEGVVLSAALANPVKWAANEEYVYFFDRVNTGKYPETLVLPQGPAIQESSGKKSTIRTYQDLLRNKSDETKFDFYATTRIKRYNPATRKVENFLPEKVYTYMDVSPNGNYVLAYELNAPYSYLLPYSFFPYTVTVYDKDGKFAAEIAKKPLRDNIPQGFDATETGERDIQWRTDVPATLVYVKALDEGDPKKEVPYRDEVYMLRFPDQNIGNTVMMRETIGKCINRFQGIEFGPNGSVIISDGWWKTRNEKVYLVNMSGKDPVQQTIFDYSTEDVYKLPGYFITRRNAQGHTVLLSNAKGTKLYLQGEGFAADGKKAFIDEYDIKSGSVKRLWQADGKSTLERIGKIVDLEKGDIITRIESPGKYPNYYLRNIKSKKMPVQLTHYENPYKSIENITRKKIEYTRKDGVKLFATLYLPAGYESGRDGRLPMLVHAYPTEFKEDKAAGQRQDSPYEFTYINWSSPIFWVTRGYAVLDNAQFPIIGKGDTEPNDTYIEQLVANAQAALDATWQMGVCDTHRVAVMGHSYGAFMTANLLAHSNLFAAGIARSGAYNRTLTPFGFQSEERTYWQAMDVYTKMSPFTYADKINEPLLMIHGDADNNPGTFTLQSERLFQAIKGLGGMARLVLLPYESHGYAAKENVFHMLWEMDTWLEKYVKNRK